MGEVPAVRAGMSRVHPQSPLPLRVAVALRVWLEERPELAGQVQRLEATEVPRHVWDDVAQEVVEVVRASLQVRTVEPAVRVESDAEGAVVDTATQVAQPLVAQEVLVEMVPSL